MNIKIKKQKNFWTNKKIALVSILIATSVAFVVIFTRIVPIASIPSFKISLAGLPIKITGYIFGPLIGALTGAISDLLSFSMIPVFFHWSYIVAFACAGFIPGIVGYIMHRRWKYKGSKNPDDNFKYNNANFVFAIFIILIVMALITIFVFSSLSNFSESLIKNKLSFYGVVISGSGTMLIAVIVFRFVLKPKVFNALLPIIVFSVILDIVNTPLVSYGDSKTLQDGREFLTLLTAHTLLTPIKSWANMFVIYFSYKIISPLIFNKTMNGWNHVNVMKAPQTREQKIKGIDEGKKTGEL